MFRVLFVSLGILLFSTLPKATFLESVVFASPPAAADTIATVPTTISPVGMISPGRMVTFEWNALADAAWYYLWVSMPSGGRLDRWYDGRHICQMTICAVTPGLPTEAGLYRWWVKAWSPTTGYSEWSGETQYIVTTAAPLLTEPSGLVETSQPSFIWYASPGATWYYLWLSGPDGFVVSQWFPATNCAAGVCVQSSLVLAPGEYHWWLQAWQDHGGYSPWSTGLAFTIDDGVSTPPPPDWIEPTEEVTATLEPTEEVTATLEPTEEVTATLEPTEEVTATLEPTEEVTATIEPTEEVTATIEPTEEVTATLEPTSAPTEATATVEPTPEPTVETVTPTPTLEPTPEWETTAEATQSSDGG